MIASETRALLIYSGVLVLVLALGVGIGAASVGVYMGVHDRAFWSVPLDRPAAHVEPST